MKKCTYCGRENDDEATACRECGTEWQRPVPPALPKSQRQMTAGEFFFLFKGRISRLYFFLGWIAVSFFSIVVFILLTVAFGTEASQETRRQIATWIIVWPFLAILAKRFHDRNRSAWFLLIGLVPLVGILWLMIEGVFVKGTEGENRFGPDPLGQRTEHAG
jgi:uncharacterized membrane protein YhaH (DUF805 family)/ribosomal protein L40E